MLVDILLILADSKKTIRGRRVRPFSLVWTVLGISKLSFIFGILGFGYLAIYLTGAMA